MASTIVISRSVEQEEAGESTHKNDFNGVHFVYLDTYVGGNEETDADAELP